MKEAKTTCPDCGGTRIIGGRFLGQMDYGIGHVFRPNGLSILKLSMTSSDISASDKFQTCLDCGLLWNRLPPDKVAKTIRALGRDSTKRKLKI